MSRVLVCGGKDFNDYDLLKSCLGRHEISTIIHGNARGADSLADRYAREKGIDRIVYPANWEGHGKLAGFIRNSMMLNHGKPDKVIAFPGGVGTEMMIDIAKKAGVEVCVYEDIYGE